jgi:hypothetical protein
MGVWAFLFFGGDFVRKQSPTESWGDGVVHLNEDNSRDAVVGVEEAEGGAGGVEGLCDHDAADDRGMNLQGDVFGEKMRVRGVAPTPVQDRAEQQDVDPVGEKRNTVVDELGEQRGRERSERDGAEEGDMNPREVAIGAGELIELRLLANPEDAIGHYAH